MELDAYLDELQGYDEPTLRAALARCAEQSPRYFPTVPEIRAAAAGDLPAEAREDAERRRFWRSWLPYGVCPHYWDAAKLAEACAALGLPEPAAQAIARCEENQRNYQARQRNQRLGAD